MLADLSPKNVEFALAKSREMGLSFEAAECDARDLSRFADASFDHVLCMGPLYHLKEESDRTATISECLRVLKPGGALAAAFISSYAGMWYVLKEMPQLGLTPERDPSSFEPFLIDSDFSGFGFTDNYFARRAEIVPLFDGFGLEKLHFLSSEGVLGQCEPELLLQPPEVLAAWIDIAEQTCEREDLLSHASHFLYIGRKAK